MAAKKVTTTVYLRPDQLQRLRQIQIESGVPMAEFIRRAVDQVLDLRAPLPDAPIPAPGDVTKLLHSVGL